MDAEGARALTARIRAGVRIGAQIELVEDADDDTGLRAGDRGVVTAIAPAGSVVVSWDRGFSLQIDPAETPFRPLAA